MAQSRGAAREALESVEARGRVMGGHVEQLRARVGRLGPDGVDGGITEHVEGLVDAHRALMREVEP